MIIRSLRTDRGWSQEQLAEISGVSTRTIQRIENGGKASLESLKCLAAVFEASIQDLQKDSQMDDDEKYSNLTEEDRAALKYAHFLKSYDEQGAGENVDPGRTDHEKRIIREVRRERQFYLAFMTYIAIVVFLLIINLMTSSYMWVIWPALGMGVGIVIQAVSVFGGGMRFGDEWERRKVEERLRKL